MLYARFIETRKQPLRFFLHDFSRIGTDLRAALIASLALAVLAFGTPLAGYALFAEVLPFDDAGSVRQWESGLILLGAGIILLEVIRLPALHRLEGRLEISACSALYQQVMWIRPLFFREHGPEQVARSLNCVPRVLEALRNGSLRQLFGGFGGLAGLAVIAWFSGWLAVAALLLLLPLAIVPPLLMRLRLTCLQPHFNQRLDSLSSCSNCSKARPGGTGTCRDGPLAARLFQGKGDGLAHPAERDAQLLFCRCLSLAGDSRICRCIRRQRHARIVDGAEPPSYIIRAVCIVNCGCGLGFDSPLAGSGCVNRKAGRCRRFRLVFFRR